MASRRRTVHRETGEGGQQHWANIIGRRPLARGCNVQCRGDWAVGAGPYGWLFTLIAAPSDRIPTGMSRYERHRRRNPLLLLIILVVAVAGLTFALGDLFNEPPSTGDPTLTQMSPDAG